MTLVAWMLGLLIASGFGYATWRAHGQYVERKRAAEERMAAFVVQARTSPTPAPAPAAPAQRQQAPEERLLFDAATKAAQAGEPVLAIQLYARLLSRYPQTALATDVRAAVAAQKAKLAKA
ncbi:MAG TPA: hypothetical protein VE935_08560 [Burkholderiales bacterium]|jgi:TolA-binding protein|nr:hypothetical protein [Burkholderiales bacterium]